MIVRVLRPVTSKHKASTPLEETAPKIVPVVDEAADANAIEVSSRLFPPPPFRRKCSDMSLEFWLLDV